MEPDDTKEFADVTLTDLVRVETLGMGGFGRVELVGCPPSPPPPFPFHNILVLFGGGN